VSSVPLESPIALPPPKFRPHTPFVPARGLASAHAQTILAHALRSAAPPRLVRERWDTPDGDFVDVDVLPARPDAPHIVIVHGLEGSSRSSYVAETLRGARRRGYGALALNCRSCSGEANRLLRSYHAGETGDLAFVLSRLRERTRGPLAAIGFSLGGNALLKYLADTGRATPLLAAAAISVPYDLKTCARALDQGDAWMRIYRQRFLHKLKAKALAKAQRFPGTIDPAHLRSLSSIEAFDDVFTARIHGFASADDYYARSSSGPVLGKIRRPTLLLSSLDDPLVPADTFPTLPAQASPWLSPVVTERGGHVGFIAGSVTCPRFWAEDQALRHVARLLGEVC
jgi:predicted alpha/beta-fold hydrolase